MIFLHFTLSLLIFTVVTLPAMLIAWPCLAITLLTKWSGTTYFFGNSKWGRATYHFLVPTKGVYWRELLWMAWRNPVYNLGLYTLGVPMREYVVTGDTNVGDKMGGGFYAARMGKFWEYYWVKPYTIFGIKKCIRVRIGWKINGTDFWGRAENVFSINLFKNYLGV